MLQFTSDLQATDRAPSSAGAALGSGGAFRTAEHDDASPRQLRRWRVAFDTLLTVAEQIVVCRVHDLSPGGACVELSGEPACVPGTPMMFELPDYGQIPAEVRFARDGHLGLMFLHGEEDAVAVARHLISLGQDDCSDSHVDRVENSLVAGAVESTCVVEDVSKIGAHVLVDDTRHLTAGQNASLYLVGIGFVAATVRQVDAQEVDLVFLEDLPSGTKTQDALSKGRTELKPANGNRSVPGVGHGTNGRVSMLASQDGNARFRSPFVGSPTSTDTADDERRHIVEIEGGPKMESLDVLEARAHAAAQALADRQKREGESEWALGQLESEMQELRSHGERLESEMIALREQNERLTAERERLREENRQLSGNDKQAQANVAWLEEEIKNVLRERDKLSAILEALMAQIELNLEATATEVEDSAKVERSVATADVADDTTGMPNSDAEMGSDVEVIVASLGDEYSGDEIEKFPEDGAEKMVDRKRSVADEGAKTSAEKARGLVDRIRRRA